MGIVKDLASGTVIGDAVGLESSGEKASKEAAAIQAQAAREAGALLDPFKGIGEQGISQAGFLTDPQAQFDFLQNNPLFQMGLENLNTQTQQSAAARGRLTAGDTLAQLNQNALLAASPLIQQQKQSIGDLLNLGVNVAGNQGNLLTGQAAAQAGGVIGAQNARTANQQNLLNLAAGVSGGGGGLLGNLFGG